MLNETKKLHVSYSNNDARPEIPFVYKWLALLIWPGRFSIVRGVDSAAAGSAAACRLQEMAEIEKAELEQALEGGTHIRQGQREHDEARDQGDDEADGEEV